MFKWVYPEPADIHIVRMDTNSFARALNNLQPIRLRFFCYFFRA
ncbi:hypothetical protein DSUL_100190 [Desulfovibrionales bacterium]